MNNVIASRKFVWPAAALLIGLWLLPTIVRIVHGAITSIATRSAQQARQQEAQPQQQVTTQTAAQPVPDTKPSPAIPLSPEDQQVKTLVGLWTGQEVLADRGLCNLAFVLTEVPDRPGEYKGNTTGGCIYTPAALKLPTPRNPRELMSWAFQTSAILSGKAENGVLHFTVDKVIGERCQPTGFTFTPFSAQLAAEFTDSCGSGHIMLNRKQS